MNKHFVPNTRFQLVGSVLATAVIAGCSAQTESTPSEQVKSQPTAVDIRSDLPLRQLADQVNISIGAAVETRHLENPQFRDTFVREFSQLTPENEMKFKYVQPQQGQFDFTAADQLVDFAEQNDMVVKGHALVWHIQNPEWLENGNWSKQELSAILENHIKTVVGRYKDRVVYWDVVNEAFDDQGGFRETLWYETLGEEYIEMAFLWAHEADPDAVLFYNDYSTEGVNAKSNAVYRHVKKLVEAGVPIHGVGTQLHLTVEHQVSDVSIARNIERFSELGLDTHFTEIDVRIRDGNGDAALRDQADRYEMLAKLAAYYPEVDMFTTWGISDQYSWVPSWFNGYGRALMFDTDYQPKLAYAAVSNVLLDAVTGNFGYEPATDLSKVARFVQPFNAKPLSGDQFNEKEVVYYPFAYNQLGGKQQTLPADEVTKGKWAVGYHNNKLIGRVLRHDNKTVVDHAQVWENDNVEVFIRLGGAFWQFRSVVGQDFAPLGFPGVAKGEWNADGTQFDFTIEFDAYQDLVGETIGFNIALSDNDDVSGSRHAQLYPLTGTNIGWQGEEFGELFMNGQNAVVASSPVSAPTPFKMVRLNTMPDSVNDAAWQQGYQYSFAFNQLNQADMSAPAQSDLSGSWQVGYHQNWLYGVVNRVDDKTITSMEQSYQNDNVEVFVQRGDRTMTQFRTVVGQDFEQVHYQGGYFAQWSEDGSQLFFGIEMDSPIISGDPIGWNIALSDNDDGQGRSAQLYPVPGSNIAYLGEELTKLLAE
jgi:GH35 family endo-1,4-beta-xylanase